MPERVAKLSWICAFVGLLLLECCPIWVLQHFPSQDGPSHLYNAIVIGQWSHQPVYRQFYDVHLTPAGNLLFQLILAGLVNVAPVALAEKIILTGYMILFPLAFLGLLEAVSPAARPFSLFAFIFAPSIFFQMGFWNFMFSIPLALLALRYYLRGRARPTPLWLVLLALWGLAIYEVHMGSWIVFAMALGIFTAVDVAQWLLCRPDPLSGLARKKLTDAVLPLFTLVPPLLLAAGFMLGSQFRSVTAESVPERLIDRVKPLAALQFLRTVSDADTRFAAAFALLVCVLLALAVWLRIRRAPALATTALATTEVWLVLAGACGLLSLLAPTAVSGVLFRHRLALYGWMFLVIWLATQRWRPSLVRFTSACVCVLAALPFVWRIPDYRYWDQRISEFATVAPHVVPDATVLSIPMESMAHRVDSLLHAVDLFAPKPFIDLRNYEAATTYFPTEFRPEKRPFDSLGTLMKLQTPAPAFHLSRYERQAHTPVDYLLFYGGGSECRERTLYAQQLKHYKLTYISRPTGLVRLYERVPAPPELQAGS